MRQRFFCLRLVLIVSVLMVGCASTPPPHAPLQTSTYRTMSAEQGSDIAIHALGLVGTPYLYGGNTPQSGFDCSGLIGYVVKHRSGLTPPRTVAQLAGFGLPVSAGELRTGDLVIFGTNPPTHAGIYVGNDRFVHAPSSGGVVRMDPLSSGYWARQRPAFRRP